nr:hypothetical protein 4 [Thermoactinomycetaceae bacterium]
MRGVEALQHGDGHGPAEDGTDDAAVRVVDELPEVVATRDQ